MFTNKYRNISNKISRNAVCPFAGHDSKHKIFDIIYEREQLLIDI